RIDSLAKLSVEIDLARFLELVAHFVELGLADHLLDATLKLAGHSARLAHPKAGDAQRLREVLWPDDDQRHDPDQHQFRPAEVKKHRYRASRAFRSIARTSPVRPMMSNAANMGNFGSPCQPAAASRFGLAPPPRRPGGEAG